MSVKVLSIIKEKGMMIDDYDYDKTNNKFIQELKEQKNLTTISMIIEASMESSFQFLFQGLFSLPTIVFSFLDIYGGTLQMKDLVNWYRLSIVFSFLSFAFTSFNIRYLFFSSDMSSRNVCCAIQVCLELSFSISLALSSLLEHTNK